MAEDLAMNDPLWPMTYRGRAMPDDFESGLVSVIIPTHNRVALLPQAMDSVRAQTYRPVELIVADDGSTDGTDALVQQWAEAHDSDGRFAVRYLHQEQGGCGAARNLGLINCRGQYVQLLDSDDYLHPERFRILVKAAAEVKDFQLASTRYAIVDHEGRTVAHADPPDLTSPERLKLCIRRALWPGSPFYARRFLMEIGLHRTEMQLEEDWEYGIRVALRCRPECCRIIRRPLINFRGHPGERMTSERDACEGFRARHATVVRLLEANHLGPQYYDLLALRALHRFAGRGRFDPDYLRHARTMARSRRLKAGIAALRLLVRLFGGPLLLRLYVGYRKLRGRPVTHGHIPLDGPERPSG